MTPMEDVETYERCGICSAALNLREIIDYDSVNYCECCRDGAACIPIPLTEWLGLNVSGIRLCGNQVGARPYVGRGW